jgi:hypothetical protein
VTEATSQEAQQTMGASSGHHCKADGWQDMYARDAVLLANTTYEH